MNIKSRFLWIGIIITIIVLIGISLYTKWSKSIPVKAVTLKKGDLRVTVSATTTSIIKSENEVTLSAQRTGRIVSLPVDEGDYVDEGQTVIRLDLTEEEVKIQNRIDELKTTFIDAERNLKRLKGLLSDGIIAQQDLDAAQKIYDIAKTNYDSALKELSILQGYSIIKAPFKGIIAKKLVEKGEIVIVGTPLFEIVNPDRLYVSATIDEVDVARLKPGQTVHITLDAYQGKSFNGVIYKISPIVAGLKQETRTFEVRVKFEGNKPVLKAGMSADIEVLTDIAANVISIPTQAIMEREGKKLVYIIRDNRTALKEIEIGLSNWNFTEIKKGLEEGDIVITEPDTEGLKNGVRVNPVK
ncbi:MAG: efflux RND transporter periplasmic adaptor subunit [Nitrospirota bacterium]